MKTYNQLRSEGYIQYIVMVTSGTYEGSLVPWLVWYVLLDEDRSATEIADMFAVAFQSYVQDVNNNDGTNIPPRVHFLNLFTMQWHEAEFDAFDRYGFSNRPHFHIPVKKIVTLQGIEEYVDDDGDKGTFVRHKDGSVTSELFTSYAIESPEL